MKITLHELKRLINNSLNESVDEQQVFSALSSAVARPEDAEWVWDEINSELFRGVQATVELALSKMRPISFGQQQREENGQEDDGYSIWYNIDYPESALLGLSFKMNAEKRWARAIQSPPVLKHMKPGAVFPPLNGVLLDKVLETLAEQAVEAIDRKSSGLGIVSDETEELIFDVAARRGLFDVEVSSTDDGEDQSESPSPEIMWSLDAEPPRLEIFTESGSVIGKITKNVLIRIRTVSFPGDYEYGRYTNGFSLS